MLCVGDTIHGTGRVVFLPLIGIVPWIGLDRVPLQTIVLVISSYSCQYL